MLSSTLASLGVAAGLLAVHRRVQEHHLHAVRAHEVAVQDSIANAALLDSLSTVQTAVDSATARKQRFAMGSPALASTLLAFVEQARTRAVAITQLSVDVGGAVVIDGQAASVPAVLGVMQLLPEQVILDPRLEHISATPTAEFSGATVAGSPRGVAQRLPLAFRIHATARTPATSEGSTP
jgi:hypothetical protein